MALGRAHIVAAALPWVACAGAPEAKPSAELELSTFDVEKSPSTLGEMRLTFPWKLDNPTAANATVASVAWRLEVEGEPPQTGKAVVDQAAPAGGATEGRLEIPLSFDVSAAGFAARGEKAALRVVLTATFTVGSPRGEEVFVSDYHTEVFAPQKPVVSLEADAARYGDKSYELQFDVKIKNPNPFKLPLEGLDYRLSVKDTEILSGRLAAGLELPAASEMVFDLARNVGDDDFKELAAALKGAGTIPYRFEGQLKTKGGLILDTPLSGEIRFSTSE